MKELVRSFQMAATPEMAAMARSILTQLVEQRKGLSQRRGRL